MAPSAINTHEDYAPILINGEKCGKYNASRFYGDGARNAKQIVQAAMKERINAIDPDVCDAGEEDAFFVADMGEIYRQHLRWKMSLKRVKPHYGKFFGTTSPASCLRFPSSRKVQP